ncbi:MAG: hypothetical protein QG585_374 [Patescibacteria group bacterium]|jgi:undecaprenyl-diphosphatase|nr:hypothetical protein [Patescibacteria group bacterium]
MEEFILQFLNNHIEAFTYFGSYILFLAGFIESMPFFGFFIPGQTIVLLGGFIAKFSGENFFLFFLASTIGAIVGDTTAYFFGKKYGYSILKLCGGDSIKPIYIEETKTLLQEHTGKTLIMGRFNSLTRSLAPFIAGTANVPFGKFTYFTVLGGISWALSFSLIGYGLGASFDILGIAVGKFLSFAIIIITLIIIVISYAKRTGFKITNGEIIATGYSLIAIYVFATISQVIFKATQIPQIDHQINQYFLHNPTLISFMKIVTTFGEKWVVIFLTILLSSILWLKKKRLDAATFLISVLSSAFFIFLFKTLFSRDRPAFAYITETGSSFPSGHAVIGATFFTSLYFIFGKHMTGYKKIILLTISIIFPVLIAFSRIALGVHFISDVLAGLALGIFISCVVEILAKFLPWIYKRVKNKEVIPNL